MHHFPRSFGIEVLLLGVVVLWSSTFIISKAVFSEIGPLAYTFVRFVLMLAVAFGVLAVNARGRSALWRVQRTDVPRFLLVGLLGYTVYQLGFVLGLDRTSPFSSSLIIAMVPLFTLVVLALLRESTTRLAWTGLLVAVVGVLIFLSDKSTSSGTFVGDALSAVASLSFACYGLANRTLVKRYAAPTYTAYTLLAGTVPLLLVCAPGALSQDWRAVSPLAWLGVAYMAVFPVYLAYQLWNFAIARRGASAASSFTLLVPIISGVASALVFGEQFGIPKLLGSALVLAGLVLPRVLPTFFRTAPSAAA